MRKGMWFGGPITQPVGVAGSRSLFDPQRLVELLAMAAGAEPVAILRMGRVPDFPDRSNPGVGQLGLRPAWVDGGTSADGALRLRTRALVSSRTRTIHAACPRSRGSHRITRTSIPTHRPRSTRSALVLTRQVSPCCARQRRSSDQRDRRRPARLTDLDVMQARLRQPCSIGLLVMHPTAGRPGPQPGCVECHGPPRRGIRCRRQYVDDGKPSVAS